MSNEDVNLFDPDNFAVSTPLNGALGTIKEVELIRHNYGGKATDEATGLQVTIQADHLEHDRVNLYSCGKAGGLYPSDDGKTRAAHGYYFVGTPTKGTRYEDFMSALKKAGFDPAQMKDGGGFAVLKGKTFLWGVIERKVFGEMKAYEVPTEYIKEEDAAGTAGDAEVEEQVRAAVVKALEATPEFPRSQITVKVGPLLAGIANRSAATTLLFSDAFLASIPGVTFDKKVLRKA